jgi:hypothetical protein
VTTLSFVSSHKDKTEGFRDTLSCYFCRGYDSRGKGQEQAVQLSRKRTTLLACLQKMRKRLQDRHGFMCAHAVAKLAATDAQTGASVSPDTPNVLEAMVQLEARTRAKAANKLALDAEKEKDDEQEVQKLKQLLAKRTRTHSTTANDHEVFFLTLRGTTVSESTAAGENLVHW